MLHLIYVKNFTYSLLINVLFFILVILFKEAYVAFYNLTTQRCKQLLSKCN